MRRSGGTLRKAAVARTRKTQRRLDSRRVSKIYDRRTRYSLKEPNEVSAEQSLKDQHDFELALVQDFEQLTQDFYEGAQQDRTFRLDRRVGANLYVAAQKVAT